MLDYDLLLPIPAQPISYQSQVRPILERRCVVCHGCYDAPCQLKLSSPEGLQRGASKQKVYDGKRILAMEPTRLFIDARSTEEWREKGFHPVVNEAQVDPESNLLDSVLYRMLRLKQLHPQPPVGMLPDSFDLDLERRQSCPSAAEFDTFAKRHPLWGMPYALPNLKDAEYATLVQWLAQGAPVQPQPVGSERAGNQIERWERFLNGASNRQRLMARYLYEHLFHAHLHLQGTPAREFYRLVRSRTAPGQPLDEIAAPRPFDDPGADPFYYRILPYHPGIVAKDHVVYPLSDARMARFKKLFLEPEYEVASLPSYAPEIATNPFKSFAAIPARSRYLFLLDDARFFIEGFTKGPVCRGQVALNVIEDRFWVMFLDPDKYTTSLDSEFLDGMSDYLRMPMRRQKPIGLRAIWTEHWRRQRGYMEARQEKFEKVGVHDLDTAMDYIWDGEGTNPNAALTVFRHFDSASVAFGLLGDDPETAWVMDYPLLERVHYLLVAGFDVFGNVGHQLNTRVFMDFLRMEGENHFLAFLPTSHRKAIRDSWYTGIRSDLLQYFKQPGAWLEVESVRGYRSDDPQHELYGWLKEHLASARGRGRGHNRCGSGPCSGERLSAGTKRANEAMARIAKMSGSHLRAFPDVSFVRIRGGEGEPDLAYSLIRNKAYKNVTSLLDDASQRDAGDLHGDTLTVLDWLEGAYPNFFFVVDLADIDTFADRYASIRNRDDYERFVGLYGVRRTNQRFWDTADWFNDRYAREKPRLSGLFDLNRYRNR
ncbi:MAG: fatty acid cis/trans isomerase [Pseudomonadota bacterium]|nr:fatty acid cis/trans isomerase [Pseudomonadota bacterium]